MELDHEAGTWLLRIQAEAAKVPEKWMTPDGRFYIQIVAIDEVVLVPKDEALMTMSDQEFAKIVDDPYWTIVAKALYAKCQKVKV